MKLLGIITILLLSSWALHAGDKDHKTFIFDVTSSKQTGSLRFFTPSGLGCNLRDIEDYVRDAAAYPVPQRFVGIYVDVDASVSDLMAFLQLFAKYDVKDVVVSTEGTRLVIKNFEIPSK